MEINTIYMFLGLIILLVSIIAFFIGPFWLMLVSLLGSFFSGLIITLATNTPNSFILGIFLGSLIMITLAFTGWFTKYYHRKGIQRLQEVMSTVLNNDWMNQVTSPNLQADEKIIKKAGANHLITFDSSGGRLYLTNYRLFFKSHPKNLRPHELSIPLTEIVAVKPYRIGLIIPKGLLITKRNGKTERFIVGNNSLWSKQVFGVLKKDNN